MKIKISITGVAPLLMHNSRLSDPLDIYSKELKKITSKTKKTDDDHMEAGRLEFLGGLYWTKESGVFIPGINLERSIVEGGRLTKQGKGVERALYVNDVVIPLIYEGPRTPNELWEDGRFSYRASVKNQQSRVIRTRPIFTEWALETDADLDTTALDLADLKLIATKSGQLVGLGDYRPGSPKGGKFGRYIAQISEIN